MVVFMSSGVSWKVWAYLRGIALFELELILISGLALFEFDVLLNPDG